ncbi:hypothetical protein TWF694_003748 [Orbilia ellipsospora]|uniref:Uncharacterized protein n=1 Tax=Orbilia ellipsospora TaxID=2528407 RepID=A0AAV9WZ60_9PEZI
MKFSVVILAVLSTVVMAAPAASPHPESDLAILQELTKRQTFGCSSICSGGRVLCWSCTSGGCSYTYQKC